MLTTLSLRLQSGPKSNPPIVFVIKNIVRFSIIFRILSLAHSVTHRRCTAPPSQTRSYTSVYSVWRRVWDMVI